MKLRVQVTSISSNDGLKSSFHPYYLLHDPRSNRFRLDGYDCYDWSKRDRSSKKLSPLKKIGSLGPNAIKVPNAADLWIVKKIRYHSPPIVLLVLK